MLWVRRDCVADLTPELMGAWVLRWRCTAVGSAEDPEKILDQAVNEMQGDLIKMRQASAQARHCWPTTVQLTGLQELTQRCMQVLASQRQVEAKYESAQETAVRVVASCLLSSSAMVAAAQPVSPMQDAWEKRAELAVRKGDDDLAREALRRKQSYQVLQLIVVQEREGCNQLELS